MRNRNFMGKTLLVGAGAALVTVLNLSAAFTAPLSIRDEPLFLNEQPPPLNMLVMSRDHRMYYEAYNDASDLDGDGQIDATYKTDPLFEYYGYFESDRCYSYNSGVFVPAGAATNKKCAGGAGGLWSGDWLNYVTTSRIDALRKVLYGGLRSTDTAGTTVLQRAFIPQDAHSWGKEYTSVAVNGYDITEYAGVGMPTAGTRHLFANTTPSVSALTAGNPNPAINGVGLPLMRVLVNRNNRIWDWLSAERLVADTNIHAGASQGGVTPTDYVVRVQVCGAGTYNEAKTNCKTYGSGNAKPTGLLQEYGENDTMLFGLLSGSYGRPHDGGVLRKAVASLKNEIDLTNGVFDYSMSPPGIINTIDRLRITTFNYDVYSCGWITNSSDAAGACSMWGNPTAEMMYEVVRYFSGASAATGLFSSGANNAEETGIGLGVSSWNSSTDPYKNHPRCSKPFQTVISDINPSYDSDHVPGSFFSGHSDSDAPINASSIGQTIWTREMGATGRYFIGQSGALYDGAPTVKNVGSFGNIRGLAPEGPTKEGSYNSAAVAYYGLTNDLSDAQGLQKMQTFAVALASPLPTINVQVGGGRVSLVPYAKSVGGSGINAGSGHYQPTNQIVDFYVDTLTPTYGKFRVNFEDVEQGADHDMDAISIYEYQVSGDDITVTVTSEYAAGGIIQHMGYVISGTSQDGTYLVVRDVDTAANGDVDYFLDTPPGQPPGGTWNDGQPLPAGSANPVARTFTVSTSASAAGFLKDPLFYAAKWGGFDDTKGGTIPDVPDATGEWDGDGDGVPDNYFLVTNALELKDKLGAAFKAISDKSGSAAAAAVSSGSISENTSVYLATFDAERWGGDLKAYPVSDGDVNNDGTPDVPEGTLMTPASWSAASLIPAYGSRRIFTVSPTPASSTTGIYRDALPFTWADVSPITALKAQLKPAPLELDARTQQRLDYLRGDRSLETTAGGFRERDSALGDIVNSAPVYVGAPRAFYRDSLESVAYSGFRATHTNRPKTIYVGANDGMLHAFDAESGQERFAFIPRSVFANLYRLSDPDYAHRFYVDGSPTVADAFIGSQWRTVLAAGLNKGGQGVYALDITSPGSVVNTDASADSLFMWEFTDAQSAELGFTYSRPIITRMRNGQWVAIFGNGYNNTDTRDGTDTHVSATGNAVLYIVDLATGALVVPPIDTGVGMAEDPLAQSRPNGLATPNVVDINGDSIADYAYAGDLFGNLWKFDLSSNNPSDWGLMYGEPLFKAVNSDGRPQPITEKPTAEFGPNGVGLVVLFGTGKFLESIDRDIGSAIKQSFYGIYDANTGTASDVVSGRGDLVQQTILGETTTTFNGAPIGVRVTSDNIVDPVAKDGWFIDLVSPSGFQGEMQVTDPVLRNGRVIFTTLIPDTDVCAYGGRSWLMEMDAISGSRLSYSPFDFNDDKSFNETDYITVTVGATTLTVPASGFSQGQILAQPRLLAGENQDFGIVPGSGSQEPPPLPGFSPGPGATGRQSWRQLR